MIDKYLAWLNVQISILEGKIVSMDDGKGKHEQFIKLHMLKEAKNSYCRITGGKNA